MVLSLRTTGSLPVDMATDMAMDMGTDMSTRRRERDEKKLDGNVELFLGI